MLNIDAKGLRKRFTLQATQRFADEMRIKVNSRISICFTLVTQLPISYFKLIKNPNKRLTLNFAVSLSRSAAAVRCTLFDATPPHAAASPPTAVALSAIAVTPPRVTAYSSTAAAALSAYLLHCLSQLHLRQIELNFGRTPLHIH